MLSTLIDLVGYAGANQMGEWRVGYSLSSLRPAILAALLAITLTGCVSLAGSQDRIIDPRQPDGGLPGMSVRDVLRQYDAPTDTSTSTIVIEERVRRGVTRRSTVNGVAQRDRVAATGQELRGNRTRREWRDYVVRIYAAAINANYNDFSSRMSSEHREIGLGADVVINALTNYATVARQAITQQLAAASAGFAGLRGAVDRNVYFDRTTTAFVLSMDAQRAQIQARIERGLGESDEVYSLHAAIRDLQLLEEAGSLDRAIGDITRSADEQRRLAAQELATVVQVCQVVDDDVIDLVDRLGTFADDLADSSKATAADTLVARTQALQQMGRLAGLSADLVISASPAQIASLIGQQLVRGQNGRCAAADYRLLLERIETETQRTVPQ